MQLSVPNADDKPMLWGNYYGTPNQTITILDGFKSKLKKNQIVYMKGCDLVNDQTLESYLDQCSIDGKPGIKATFWNNPERQGRTCLFAPYHPAYQRNYIRITYFRPRSES